MNATQKKLSIQSLLIPVVVLCIRFGPSLAGLEWSFFVRKTMNIAVAAALLLWCVIWAVLTKNKMRCLLAFPVGLMACCILFYQIILFPSCVEQTVLQDGVTYLTENTDPGSLAQVQLYPYVDEVFRGLHPDWNAWETYFHS